MGGNIEHLRKLMCTYIYFILFGSSNEMLKFKADADVASFPLLKISLKLLALR